VVLVQAALEGADQPAAWATSGPLPAMGHGIRLASSPASCQLGHPLPTA